MTTTKSSVSESQDCVSDTCPEQFFKGTISELWFAEGREMVNARTGERRPREGFEQWLVDQHYRGDP